MSYFPPGQQLPAFRLSDNHGRMFNLADYRQRRNVIVLLIGRDHDAGVEQLLQGFAQQQAAFRDENTILVAVRIGSEAADEVKQQPLALPGVLLIDDLGQIHQQLGMACNQSAPFLIYITDRAGVVIAHYPSAESDTLTTVEELLEWVRYIELRCPE